MARKILLELLALVLALMFVGVSSLDFSDFSATGLAAGDNCNVRFTSNVSACFRVFRADGSVSHDRQCVNIGGQTASLDLAAGVWDMQLQTNDPYYAFSSVSPVGTQNCTAGGSVQWNWTFTRTSASPCRVNFTSNADACFRVFRTDGTQSHNNQCNVGGATASLSLPPGRWDMQLQANDPNYIFSSVNPAGAQNCPSGGSVLWAWRFEQKPPGVPQVQHDLQLKKGWNLISTHMLGSTPFRSFASDCNYDSSLWRYRNDINQYSEATVITGAREGFWINTTNNCTARIRGDDAYTLSTYFGNGINIVPGLNGWNLIGGIPESKPFNNIKGTCTFTRGPYWWNPATNSYETPGNMEPGKGYWIRVSSACQLSYSGTGSSSPPAAPV